MSCLNSRTSEKMNSPLQETTNLQNLELKNSWNKLNGKDCDAENDDHPDASKIDDLVEQIEPSTSAFKNFRTQNYIHAKRAKLDSEEYESSMDHPPYHAVQQEVQDDCDATGKCVTAQLRQMTKMQKFLAQRLIAEICFRGQIQGLQMNTVLNNHSNVFQQHQQPQPLPVISARPGHFNRGSDFLIGHQQNMRHQSHMTPMNANTAVNVSVVPPQYQNFANLQQQSEHMSVAAINHVANLGQNDT